MAKFTLALFLFTIPAFAQQRVIAAGAYVDASCKSAIEATGNNLRVIGNGKPWTWAVVCSERDWNLITRGAGIDKQTDCAVTLLSRSFTYLRSECLINPKPGVTTAYVIAHEIGHIQTGSTNEKSADAWAKQHGYS